MKPIILASESPRRKELLKQLKLEFDVVPSNYKEDMSVKLRPLKLAKLLSGNKAKEVAKKYKNNIIIAADTFIAYKNELLGKPHTSSMAKKMLAKISGKKLSVITGLTVIETPQNKVISKAIETKVFIKELSNLEIDNYVKTKEPLDKAGAFAIQGLGAAIVKKIEGDCYNVVGLPIFDLIRTLEKFGVDIFR